ncbi:unnamed protein product [Paramecium pentaurelia]|uniref:Uncharacterized protein n=1 Tax=Paramecium pentaurelia TaxID=43138 RepID=A0A8S1TQ31_9CILI|nr:unnamed protein product [Paramecium pentaurelia]
MDISLRIKMILRSRIIFVKLPQNQIIYVDIIQHLQIHVHLQHIIYGQIPQQISYVNIKMGQLKFLLNQCSSYTSKTGFTNKLTWHNVKSNKILNDEKFQFSINKFVTTKQNMLIIQLPEYMKIKLLIDHPQNPIISELLNNVHIILIQQHMLMQFQQQQLILTQPKSQADLNQEKEVLELILINELQILQRSLLYISCLCRLYNCFYNNIC